MKLTTVIILFAVVIFLYCFSIYVISSYDEILRIERLTKHYNTCDKEEFERKLSGLLIEFDVIPNFNFFLERNEHIFSYAAVTYPKNKKFREMCYRCGLKQRLEKVLETLKP